MSGSGSGVAGALDVAGDAPDEPTCLALFFLRGADVEALGSGGTPVDAARASSDAGARSIATVGGSAATAATEADARGKSTRGALPAIATM